LDVNKYYRNMKKFLFLLLFLLLFSCHKPSSDYAEKTYCWDCILNTGYNPHIYGVPATTSTSHVEYCDKTQMEINKIMLDNFHEGNQYYSNMDCSKAR